MNHETIIETKKAFDEMLQPSPAFRLRSIMRDLTAVRADIYALNGRGCSAFQVYIAYAHDYCVAVETQLRGAINTLEGGDETQP